MQVNFTRDYKTVDKVKEIKLYSEKIHFENNQQIKKKGYSMGILVHVMNVHAFHTFTLYGHGVKQIIIITHSLLGRQIQARFDTMSALRLSYHPLPVAGPRAHCSLQRGQLLPAATSASPHRAHSAAPTSWYWYWSPWPRPSQWSPHPAPPCSQSSPRPPSLRPPQTPPRSPSS